MALYLVFGGAEPSMYTFEINQSDVMSYLGKMNVCYSVADFDMDFPYTNWYRLSRLALEILEKKHFWQRCSEQCEYE